VAGQGVAEGQLHERGFNADEGLRCGPTGRKNVTAALSQDCALLVLGYFRVFPLGRKSQDCALLMLGYFRVFPLGRKSQDCALLLLGYFRVFPLGRKPQDCALLLPGYFRAFPLGRKSQDCALLLLGYFRVFPLGRKSQDCALLLLGYFRVFPLGRRRSLPGFGNERNEPRQQKNVQAVALGLAGASCRFTVLWSPRPSDQREYLPANCTKRSEKSPIRVVAGGVAIRYGDRGHSTTPNVRLSQPQGD
jgi:hypothetical protein